MPNRNKGGNIKKWWIIIALAFFVILFTLSGIYYYKFESNLIKEEKLSDLKGIASMKSEQISDWYGDEIFDIMSISKRMATIEYSKQLNEKKIYKNPEQIKNYFQEVADINGYENLILYNPVNQNSLVYLGTSEKFDERLLKTIDQAIQKDSTLSTDLYKCTNCKAIHIDFVAPVYDESNMLLAVIIGRQDPNKYLYPLIEQWPTRSKSSETLLIRQEGDSVLFVNELRHLPGSALKLKISLERTDVPAVQAVKGFRGIWEGTDYREVQVISEVLSIKNTPWFMIAKVDRDEIFSEINYRTVVIIVFIIMLIGASGFALSFTYQYKQRNIYKELYHKETALANKEEEYKTTLYSIGDGVITTDRQGRVKQMNQVAEKLTGWTEDEARGRLLSEVFIIKNEYTGELVDNPVNKVLREGLVVGLANHTILVSKNGRELPIADSGAPIKDNKENIIGVVLVFRDQTEERETERKLKESEAGLKYAQQQANLGSWDIEVGAEAGKWSDEMFRIYGLDPEKGIPDIPEFLERIHPDDRELIRSTLEKLFKGIDPEVKEFRTNPEHGPVKYLLPTYQIIKDENGNPVKYAGTTLDITDRKLTEIALKESEEIFNHFMDKSPIYIFFKDKNLRSLRLSKNYEQLMGMPINDLLGKSFSELFPDSEHIRILEENDRQTMKSGQLVELENEANGKFYTTIKFPIMIDGKAEYLAGFSMDITERKKMIEDLVDAKNEAEKADKLKFEFLAQMSHEIRTPLNTVLNYTSLLKDECQLNVTDDTEQIFYGIDSASKRVIRTIDLILNISQVTTDAYDFHEKEIDLYSDVMLQMERELTQTAKLKGLELIIEKDAEDTRLLADEYSVSQIFINLVENAIKYTKQGSVKVKIVRNSQGRLKVDISDTGIGMSEEFLDNLFLPFSQEESGYTRRYEGTGLGLHLVKKYCEMNNAEISVTSAKNEGSVFTVVFNNWF